MKIKAHIHTPVDDSDMTEKDNYYLDYKGIIAQLVRAVAQLEARIAELENAQWKFQLKMIFSNIYIYVNYL